MSIKPTKGELAQLVRALKGNKGDVELFLLSRIKELENKLEEMTKDDIFVSRIVANTSKLKQGDKGEKGDTGEQGTQGKEGIQGEQGNNGEVGKDGKDGKNGKEGNDGKDGRDGEKGEQGEAGDIKDLSPEETRNSLELLQGDERLDISAIKGLEDELGKRNNIPVITGFTGRELFKDIDISDQLNGVDKTFSIPAIYNILTVDLSSFPNALRKTVDYTYTDTTITFTSEINAGSSLATGQTCILTVVLA